MNKKGMAGWQLAFIILALLLLVVAGFMYYNWNLGVDSTLNQTTNLIHP
jgi:hypothetical protein